VDSRGKTLAETHTAQKHLEKTPGGNIQCCRPFIRLLQASHGNWARVAEQRILQHLYDPLPFVSDNLLLRIC